MNYLVEVDKSKCIGCGSCSALAPEVFGFDSENNVSVVKEDAVLTDLELLLKAAASCPVSAISVRDENGTVLTKE